MAASASSAGKERGKSMASERDVESQLCLGMRGYVGSTSTSVPVGGASGWLHWTAHDLWHADRADFTK